MPHSINIAGLFPGQNISIPTVTSLSDDSRHVKTGGLFVAIKGNSSNGELHIPQAINNGAIVIVTSENYDQTLPPNITHLKTASPRMMLSALSRLFYPEHPETTVAVTGTNGKSSVAHFIRQIWSQLGYRAASIGTLGITTSAGAKEKNQKLELTSPGPLQLHKTLHTLASEQHITHCIFEASSHALDQHRIDSASLSAAAFTNLSQDHLDYHNTMQSYFDAKLRLFTELLPPGKPAVLNADTDKYQDLLENSQGAGHKVFSYGKKGGNLKLLSISHATDNCSLTIEINGSQYHTTSPFSAYFQIENILCAASIAISLGEKPEEVIKCIPLLNAPPGRMELIGKTKKNASVFVDFAHTPDALERTLQELRVQTTNKLHVVFGCGGDRDQGKREPMGRIAHEIADEIYITDDNPRSEDRAVIRNQIKAAAPNAYDNEDRQLCILHALNNLENGDILLVAGKGHETVQIINAQHIPFDDRQIIKTYLGKEVIS